MAAIGETKRRWALVTGLRGLLMLVAGLFAVFTPGAALTVAVIFGGALLLIDGLLGLWSLTFGGAKTGNFWFDVVRNALAIIAGLMILVSPLLATVFTAAVLTVMVGIQALIVGGMEIYVVIRERHHYARIWPVLLSGVLYVLFGLALLFAPLISALVLVTMAGLLAILFSIGLFALAWRLWKE